MRAVPGGGGLSTDFELDGGLISVAHSLGGGGFDASEVGTGRGTLLVPIAFSSKDFSAGTPAKSPRVYFFTHQRTIKFAIYPR